MSLYLQPSTFDSAELVAGRFPTSEFRLCLFFYSDFLNHLTLYPSTLLFQVSSNQHPNRILLPCALSMFVQPATRIQKPEDRGQKRDIDRSICCPQIALHNARCPMSSLRGVGPKVRRLPYAPLPQFLIFSTLTFPSSWLVPHPATRTSQLATRIPHLASRTSQLASRNSHRV